MVSVQAMQRLVVGNMLLYFLFLGAVVSAPADSKNENNNLENILTDVKLHDKSSMMRSMPSGFQSENIKPEINAKPKIEDYYKKLNDLHQKGCTSKNLTFNIYDDAMKDATVAIFNILRNFEPEETLSFRVWAQQNINDQMYDYAERMYSLVTFNPELFSIKAKQPPFLLRPNFYVNAETITKALKHTVSFLRTSTEGNTIKPNLEKAEITLNSNYSHWNNPLEDCADKIDYFREDIGLNAYYFGVHLLHPHWMSDEELSQLNRKYGEHYYFRHQQLIARYNLEKEGLRQRSVSMDSECEFYDSYLTYSNGLPFPTRSAIKEDWSNEKSRLKMVEILLTEYISRGTVVMGNGTIVTLTEENHIDLLSKVIRANYDGDRTAKTSRSLYGYGRNGYPTDKYNPAPSLFHQPETCLRDPAYWFFIQYLLNYITEYQKSIEPFDVSKYENNDIIITDANFHQLTTIFANYEFQIDKAIEDNDDPNLSYIARKRRIMHLPVEFNFNVISNIEQDVVVRLFLGPPCKNEDCWEQYQKYVQLDAYRYTLGLGENIITWTPETSSRYTTDAMFNKGISISEKDTEYNLFRFPQNLLLPKGLEEGLNLTLFIMVTPVDSQNDIRDIDKLYATNKLHYYSLNNFEVDDRPLGFPFHMPSKKYKNEVNNYRFYNVTVFHTKRSADDYYFSPHLY